MDNSNNNNNNHKVTLHSCIRRRLIFSACFCRYFILLYSFSFPIILSITFRSLFHLNKRNFQEYDLYRGGRGIMGISVLQPKFLLSSTCSLHSFVLLSCTLHNLVELFLTVEEGSHANWSIIIPILTFVAATWWPTGLFTTECHRETKQIVSLYILNFGQ